MKLRIAFLAVALLVTLAVFAPASQAVTRKLYVTIQPGSMGLCRASTDQIGIQYTYKAKIKRRNSPNPSKIYVNHKVTDSNTGQVLQSTKLVLKPSRSKARHFFKAAPQVLLTAGQQFVVSYTAWYKSPLDGRRMRTQASSPDYVPSVEQLDAAGLPPCAAG